jgi:hypothetical protein
MAAMRKCYRSAAISIFCSLTTMLLPPPSAGAATVSLPAVKDNTLLRYDPADPNTALNSNGSGDFFSAGRTFARDEIRRGLVQFDLSSLSTNSQLVPGSVHLRLRVIGIPSRDTTPRPFWVVGLTGLAGPWGEGASVANIAVSGSGSGAPAQPGDATWFHTSYDANIHDMTSFVSGGTGYWTQQGAIGNTAIADPAAVFGPAAGISGSTQDFVDFTSASMENDVSQWLADPAKNFGWIIVSDEGVTGSNASSKRDFASREHANAAFRPVLLFDVVSVPEPSAVVLCIMGLFAASLPSGRRRGIVELE